MAFRLPGDEPRDKVTEKVWGICYAASRGDVHKLRSYIHQEGIMLNENYRIGAAALLLATEQGHAKALKTLIAAGADVNMSQSERKSLTPLMNAAGKGDVDCLIALIEGGAKVNAVRYDGQTSLAIAIQEGCSDDVKDVIGAKTHVRTRPLIGSLVMTANRSWKEQHEECAMLLLQAGADVGYTSESGYSLLMSSAANGSIKIVKSLIQAGANINQTANNGATALHLACRCTSLLDYRLYKECVDVLLQAGAAVNAANSDGKTALILAVENSSRYKKKFQRTDIIQLLLQAGADTNMQDKTGKTALMYAAEKNVTSFCEMLMNHSADVNIQDSIGKTAYMHVTEGRCLEVLLTPTASVNNCKRNDRGSQDKSQNNHLAVSLNVQDKEVKTTVIHTSGGTLTNCRGLPTERYYNNFLESKRQTAWIYASQSDYVLDAQAMNNLHHDHTVPNTNIQDHDGKTALMHAARQNLTHCCRLLLERNAAPNIQDNSGKTALMYARGADTVRVLLSNGADPEIVDNSNCTALVHLLQREIQINEVINTVTLILEHGANPVVDTSYHHQLLFGSHPSSSDSLMESLIAEGRRHIIRLLVCNGFVTRAAPNRYLPNRYTSPLCRALNVGCIDIVKYCIACCYLRESDLRDLRTLASTPQSRGPGLPSPSDMSDEIRLFVQQVVSQPWPLVKLAFIAVSSALGASPERSRKIAQTRLPARLQRMLMFQEPVSRLPVNEWVNIPLCFDPSDYERMPRTRPLLYYWPFGREMVI